MLSLIKRIISFVDPSQNSNFVGSQLRKPHGLLASKVASGMNLSNKALYETMIQNLKPNDYDNILEIGFGNGYYFNDIYETNDTINLLGVEISREMLYECRKINHALISENKLDIRLGTDNQLPFPADSIDKVIAINLIYFWENPSASIDEIFRVLKSKGEVHIGIRPYNILSKLPFAKNHFNIQTDNWWINQFEKSGFILTQEVTQSESPIIFNKESYEMCGKNLIFKKGK